MLWDMVYLWLLNKIEWYVVFIMYLRFLYFCGFFGFGYVNMIMRNL